MTRYRNPHHKPGYPNCGPEFYETSFIPTEYRGYQIFNPLGYIFHVVKDGVCVIHVAGSDGICRAIDERINKLSPYFCPGTFWELPKGMNWDALIAERKKWNIDPMMVPLASGPGVTGWGRLLPGDYRVAA